MNDDEAAATFGEFRELGLLLFRGVAAGLRVHHDDIGGAELLGARPAQRAIRLDPPLGEQLFPIIEEALVFVGIRAVRLLAGANKHPKRLGLRGQGESAEDEEGEQTFHRVRFFGRERRWRALPSR
jgi:hypothetical protein